jgi:type I restriction enzyme M protein
MPEKEYKPTEELEAKEGYVKDPVSGRLVKITPERVEAKIVFAQRLLNEYGYSKKQIQTFPEFYIQKGSTKIGPADIVVFKDDKKTFDNIYLVIETKRKDKKDGIKQLKSYIDPTPAEGGVWFNGNEIAYCRAIRKPPSYTPELVEWRNIPKKGQTWEEIGKYKSGDDLIPAKNLKPIFKVIYYHLYTNSNLPRAERLGGEMIRLIFCKIYDEIHNDKDLKFKAGAQEIDERVAERVKGLFEKVKKEYQDVFEGDEKLVLDAKSIAYVVSQLQNYSLLKTDKDAVGDAFEVFIGPALRGEKGQFFTPRNVVRLCVEMLDPKPDERVIDPACGSGGFLIVALEHVWKEIEEKYKHLSKEKIGSIKTEIASKNFYGIDKEFDLAKVSKAYMAIVGDGRGGIFCADSLVGTEEWTPIQREKIKPGSFDVLLTNPPFGSKIPITSKSLLEQYQLGFKWKMNKKTDKWDRTDKVLDKQVPQILFIERCLQLLKPGGRMAIVLPEGVFGNPTDRYIFEHIFENARVLAIVSCPHETFQPSTHTKTSVLFLEKITDNKNDYNFFMAIAEKAGHDKNGKMIYKMNENGEYMLGQDGKPIIDDDFPIITERYKEFRNNRNMLRNYSHLGFSFPFSGVKNYIVIPEYYNPDIEKEFKTLESTGDYELVSIQSLLDEKIISIKRGNEIGSRFYGLGDIPFVRTTDIVNWEIKIDPVKCIPEEVYNKYKRKQDVRPRDILLVNDGTFLIGRSAIVTELDTKIIIQSHIRKIRVLDPTKMDPYLLFYLLNTKIVKKQVDAKTFIQATISTLGNRLNEIILPIPKDQKAKESLANKTKEIIMSKMELRKRSKEIINF